MGKLHTLKPESVEAIKKSMDVFLSFRWCLFRALLTPPAINSATSAVPGPTSQESQAKIPGTVFLAINKNGDEIFSHASGLRGLDSPEKMDLDTVFWIASCTKMIVGIACMQLVEQGRLKLDDADLVDRVIIS